MSGDQQERVEQAPPVCLGEIPAHRARERRQRGHEPDGELGGVRAERLGDGRDGLPESGGAPEPDERAGHPG